MKIMVGYDATSGGKTVLNLAVTFAKAFNGKLFIVTSMTKGTDAEQEAIKHIESELAMVKNEMESQGVPSETHLLIRGMVPGEDLVEFARENQMDQIVIGVRRTSKVGKLVFGSSAQYVILNAHCPVTTIK